MYSWGASPPLGMPSNGCLPSSWALLGMGTPPSLLAQPQPSAGRISSVGLGPCMVSAHSLWLSPAPICWPVPSRSPRVNCPGASCGSLGPRLPGPPRTTPICPSPPKNRVWVICTRSLLSHTCFITSSRGPGSWEQRLCGAPLLCSCNAFLPAASGTQGLGGSAAVPP